MYVSPRTGQRDEDQAGDQHPDDDLLAFLGRIGEDEGECEHVTHGCDFNRTRLR